MSQDDKDSEDSSNSKKKSHTAVIYSIIIIITIALVWFLVWLFYFRFVDSTDDAYVHGNQVMLNSQVSGFVTSINTQDTYLVNEGQILVELDKTDFTIALDLAALNLANTLRDVSDMFQAVKEAALNYKEQEAIVKNNAIRCKKTKM